MLLAWSSSMCDFNQRIFNKIILKSLLFLYSFLSSHTICTSLLRTAFQVENTYYTLLEQVFQYKKIKKDDISCFKF